MSAGCVRQIKVRRDEDGLTSRIRLTWHLVKHMKTFHLYSVVRLRMPKDKK